MKRFLFTFVILASLLGAGASGAFAAGGHAHANFWYPKDDCGTAAHKGLARTGSVVFTRSGDTLGWQLSIKGATPNTTFFMVLYGNDSGNPCHAIDTDTVSTDGNGNTGTFSFTFGVAGYSTFFVRVQNEGNIADTHETATVSLP